MTCRYNMPSDENEGTHQLQHEYTFSILREVKMYRSYEHQGYDEFCRLERNPYDEEDRVAKANRSPAMVNSKLTATVNGDLELRACQCVALFCTEQVRA